MVKSSFIVIILAMLDKSNNDGLTKEFVGVVVIVEVETVVEELKLGAEAINGGSNTMKSNIRKEKYEETEKRAKKKENLMN